MMPWRSDAATTTCAGFSSCARTSASIAANCSVSKVAPAPFGSSVTQSFHGSPDQTAGWAFDAAKDLGGSRNGGATHGSQIGQVAALTVQQGRAVFEMKIEECHL